MPERVEAAELGEEAVRRFLSARPLEIVHEGEVLGHFTPTAERRQALREASVARLEQVVNEVLAQTGLTEDELADLFDLSRPMSEETLQKMAAHRAGARAAGR